jgi:hypothetical protein
MPQVFEENQGQAPENYRSIARRDGATAFYRPDGVDIVLARSHGLRAHPWRNSSSFSSRTCGIAITSNHRTVKPFRLS